MPRIGTRVLVGLPLERLPWHRGDRFPVVAHPSLKRTGATFTPDAALAVSGLLQSLSRVNDCLPVLTSFLLLSTHHRQIYAGQLCDGLRTSSCVVPTHRDSSAHAFASVPPDGTHIAVILLPLATLRLHRAGSGLCLLHVSFPSAVNITIEQSDLPGTQPGGAGNSG